MRSVMRDRLAAPARGCRSRITPPAPSGPAPRAVTARVARTLSRAMRRQTKRERQKEAMQHRAMTQCQRPAMVNLAGKTVIAKDDARDGADHSMGHGGVRWAIAAAG